MLETFHFQVEVKAISTLIGEQGLKFALVLHAGLPSFMRRYDHILFTEISKQAIFSLTKT